MLWWAQEGVFSYQARGRDVRGGGCVYQSGGTFKSLLHLLLEVLNKAPELLVLLNLHIGDPNAVAALDSSTTRRVMGLLRDPPARGNYDALKAQLLRVFQLPNAEHAVHLLSLNSLGNSKPTKLMQNMLALLGSRDASFLFIQLFLSQLPPPVSTALASSPLLRTKDYQALAEEADMILLASRQYVVHAMPPTQLPWGDGMVRAPAGCG